MRIVWVRRISQVFFLLLFLWFCVASTLGTNWWQLRGWPVNGFLQLDPLVALGTLLTTRTLYAGLWWAVATIVLTIVFGRVFCGFVCPFGTLHHFFGWLSRRSKTLAQKTRFNRYRTGQSAKYYLLFLLLGAAAGELIARLSTLARGPATVPWVVVVACVIGAGLITATRIFPSAGKAAAVLLALTAAWTALAVYFPMENLVAASLQTGLLDPLPLLHRSVNLALLPILDRVGHTLSTTPRNYSGAWIIGSVFLVAISLNVVIPRFYCRFVCPLGALLGLFGRFALWRVGKSKAECSMCMRCESDCEGACDPATCIRPSECVLCMNCLRTCNDNIIGYRPSRSAAGEVTSPDLTRRGFLVSLGSGLAAVPMIRLSNTLGANWDPRVIRPPGALAEKDFLDRCIKCGQCMRICPTNIIQPAGLEAGVEGIWSPLLNFRIGTSGCQLDCVACGQVCPTAALRPLSLDEKHGRNEFAARGPVRLGTAFVDPGRCLPWSMDRPCIVCQENCPVSPKAIYVREVLSSVRDVLPAIAKADELTLEFGRAVLEPGRFATGDYFCSLSSGSDVQPRRIVDNTATGLTIASIEPWDPPPAAGARAEIQVLLQRPVVDPALCIGCGICEHECPVTGIKAIRVTAENESRDPDRAILL